MTDWATNRAPSDIGVGRTGDDHNTPESVLRVIRAFAPIGLDPCSNPWSTVGARVALSRHEGDNGLTANWNELLRPGEVTFVNPPYSDIGPWFRAAYEHDRGEFQAIFLVPCSPETGWGRTAFSVCDAFGDWAKRIPFERGSASRNSAKGPSRLYYIGPHYYRFAHHFEGYCSDLRVFPRRERLGRFLNTT